MLRRNPPAMAVPTAKTFIDGGHALLVDLHQCRG